MRCLSRRTGRTLWSYLMGAAVVLMLASPAGAVVASTPAIAVEQGAPYVYDAAVYDYDVPAHLSSKSPTSGARGSPVVHRVAPWASHASVRRFGVAAKSADEVAGALSAVERRTLDDALRPDKLDHVFDPKHNFDPLIEQFGSREAAMEEIVRSIGGPLPQSGPFQIAQSIGGQTVVIRGAVVDGVPRIGTAFTP